MVWHVFVSIVSMKEKTSAARKPPVTTSLKKKVPSSIVPMDAKSPEQLLEDIIGILNNRKELLDKLVKKFPHAHDGHRSFKQYLGQTKKFQSVLLAELSGYGDGLAGADPNNAYNDYWRNALQKWESINQPRLIPFWRTLESILRGIYKQILTRRDSLPQSFQEILVQHLAELEAARPGNSPQ
jgi:hypothetical protein